MSSELSEEERNESMAIELEHPCCLLLCSIGTQIKISVLRHYIEISQAEHKSFFTRRQLVSELAEEIFIYRIHRSSQLNLFMVLFLSFMDVLCLPHHSPILTVRISNCIFTTRILNLAQNDKIDPKRNAN